MFTLHLTDVTTLQIFYVIIMMLGNSFGHVLAMTTPSDMCSYVTCRNGGICDVTLEENVTCICSEGFYGEECEMNEIEYYRIPHWITAVVVFGCFGTMLVVATATFVASVKLKHASRQVPDEEDEAEEKVNMLPTSG